MPAPPGPQTWFITGSSSGIGLALTRHILAAGHNVIATSRTPSRTPSVVEEIATHPTNRGRWLQLDVTSAQTIIETTIAEAWELFQGGVDVVVNNAAFAVLGAIEDIGEELIEKQFATNVFGVAKICRAVVPLMRKNGKGCIVNVSSALGLSTWPSCGVYGASKFAVEGELSTHSQMGVNVAE
jgi:NAD(P)-dependent dehydrogenase (short-subunit alcohol dehydrogenase family)